MEKLKIMPINSQPMASIVIPCYKGARFLAEAIESCLRQTYQSLEIIVVDDASPDNCAEIAENYARQDQRITVIRQTVNRGVSEAFNTGFDRARGEFFTRLAQDDIFRDDAIEKLMNHLIKNQDIALVYSDMELIDEEGKVIGEWLTPPDPVHALDEEDRIGLCVMWRRVIWEKMGKFDTEFDAAEDYEYWLRVAQQYQIGRYPGASLLCWRKHQEMGSYLFHGRQIIAGASARCRYVVPESQRKSVMTQAYWDALWAYRQCGDFASAWKCATTCLKLSPMKPVYWKAALGTAFHHFS